MSGQPPRSHLYVPADQPRFLSAAPRSGADALILDLEDAVAPARKDAARAAAVAFAEARADGGPEVWVRINEGARGRDDARALIATGRLDGLWVPKATAGPDLDALLTLVDDAPGVGLGLLVESAPGLLSLGATAGLPGVRHLQLGEVDLRADLRMAPDSRAGDDLLDWARGLAVAHTAAHGLRSAVAPVSVHTSDPDAFRASSARLRATGFQGRACIHPAQVAVANEVFGVDPGELADAHALLDLFDRRIGEGSGVFRDARGEMVDAATVRRARELTGRTG
ncbi:aldolase/citrate lyase family protein [Streptomyces sp. NBC_01498]|uniref:HpcH/HpaI aldolase/citrate lyase family protein n=1 Tax=Streptomyces sp. NBC_01498 TaxID=2975870 RepID=UPI002E7AF6A3|nr:aldolase/citrate lyase family protein [Streptomyces sp. NBC_01498]WTL27006.1 aldolase/citrate lyase family protein [Streptomyces sp. NBC_01498]